MGVLRKPLNAYICSYYRMTRTLQHLYAFFMYLIVSYTSLPQSIFPSVKNLENDKIPLVS